MKPTLARRAFLQSLAVTGGALAAAPLWADESTAGLREPVHRVAKVNDLLPANGPAHPLDPALEMAHSALVRMRESVIDYTAILIKRERTKSGLGDYEYMAAKIRNRKMEGDQIKTPLSVYLKFLKPKNIEGREVLWIEGQNNNKLRAHEGGIIPIPAVWLDPDGRTAGCFDDLHDSLLLPVIIRRLGVDDQGRRSRRLTWQCRRRPERAAVSPLVADGCRRRSRSAKGRRRTPRSRAW